MVHPLFPFGPFWPWVTSTGTSGPVIKWWAINDINGLRIIPLPTVNLSENSCGIVRTWASAYGAAARQRTVKQEMSKHGTLPDFVLCQRQLDVVEMVTLKFGFDENEDVNEDHESNQSEDVSESDYNIMKTTISIRAAMKGWISL